MKKVFFILLFIPLISYCQNDNEYRFQNVSQLDWDNYCISRMDCFDLSFDINYCILLYTHGKEKKQMIDTVFSQMLYGSTLNSFKSQKDNYYLVLWKIEGEFVPTFYAYYVKDGKIMKIGEWVLFVPCKTCETVNYLIEDIKIFQNDDEIEFIFLKETSFVAYKDLSKSLDHEDWGSFQAGELIVSFNIVDGTVKRVEK